MFFPQSDSGQKSGKGDKTAEYGVTQPTQPHGDLVTLYSHSLFYVDVSTVSPSKNLTDYLGRRDMVENIVLSCPCKNHIVAFPPEISF